MFTKNCFLLGLAGSVMLVGTAASAAVVFASEYNTGTNGWGITSATGVQQATASTGEGVLTMTDITGIDPQVNRGFSGGITPGAGETWTTVEYRWRVLDASGNAVAPATSSGGTIYAGSVLVANVVFGPAPVADTVVQDDQWHVTTRDISSLGSASIAGMRYDPIGNNVNITFEVDYIRINATPEPGSLALMGLAGLMVARRRRRG